MHENRLVKETSPYLLQHAHNPVDWFAWGEEAIQKAKAEDKPILVSIGYAACHWCHVMEKESFEDESTAELMNRYFINIKVDREERPDVDHLYMDALQAMTGSGGWPLNMFLTPDLKPFYGGTYFPPVRAYNRMSWKETLEAVHKTFREKRNDIETQATNLTDHIQKSNTFFNEAENFTREDLFKMSANVLAQADTVWGGFGAAPKFPHTFVIQYLLRDYYFLGNQLSLDQALLSLDKMYQGGLYDHLAGGFARYSTDEKWLAPHFEKMLYDNALLLETYCEAYQLTKLERYAKIIDQSFDFISREFLSEEGGFYAAYDADSEGVEGKYYTWSHSEIENILGNDAEAFCEVYDVSEHGNWEETNILWLPETVETIAEKRNMTADEMDLLLKKCRSQLLAVRQKRIKPLLDDKQLLSWNALMNTACSCIYAATGNEGAKNLALQNIRFIEENFLESNKVYHSYKNGIAKIDGFLDDYAFLIRAYIKLQEVTGDQSFLVKAKQLMQTVESSFSDEENLFFFFTDNKNLDIIVRKKEVYDGATPSANAVTAENLRYLGTIFNNRSWNERASKMAGALKKATVQYPTSFGYWAKQAIEEFYGQDEVVIVGEEYLKLAKDYLSYFHPNRIFQTALKGDEDFPLFKGRNGNDSLIYLCKAYTCKSPVTTVSELVAMLNQEH